ncbi:MAG: hypothetical protein IJH12_02275 [Clostridia bacterium]|nr:hypothetical protein [Clostridia bacterium]
MKKIIKVFLIIIVTICVYGNVHFSRAIEWSEGNDTKYEDAVFSIIEINNRWGLRIEGIDKIDNPYFGIYFTNTSDVPTISELGNARFQSLSYNSKNNCYETPSGAYIDKYVQSAGDLYAWAYTKNHTDNTITIVAQSGKIEKPEFEKYYSAFNKFSGMSDILTRIVFDNMGDLGNRKFKLKIGKISDINTLIKLKQDDKSEWEKLLENAKTSDDGVVYNEDVEIGWYDAIVFNGYNGGGSYGGDIILAEEGLSKLEDSCIYYVYVNFDDEDGKYRPIECINVAKAFVNTNRKSWHLDFFNCNGDYSWDSVPDVVDSEDDEQKEELININEETGSKEQSSDENVENTAYADTKLPQAGEQVTIILAIFSVVLLFARAYRKNKKMKF